MCDSMRDAVFKKKLLRRLYGDSEESEPSTKQEQDILAQETGTDKTCITANYTCHVIPKKKVYGVITKPSDVPPSKDYPLEGLKGPEFVGEEDEISESESEEEVKKRRRRKRKQRNADSSEGQRQKQKTDGIEKANQVLTKNQKRKLKKKKRKEREKTETLGENKKGFTYSVHTEEICGQLNKSRREELCNNVPKLVEFVKAVWEVYDQDVAVKDTSYSEENLDKLLKQVSSISEREEDVVISEFDNLWHLKTLLVLADHQRVEEQIKQLDNIETVAIDNESKVLLCALMRYWMTDIVNQR
ncbi:RNA-binding protein 25-like [Pecten maximus]|uniref:RNA-binding protein 25-like n=1 Tax=Pecten maximus TaxID=6579 RepID=UPI0014590D88|nr:RNA-binding protein 25-like [Pecten maximus]